MIFHAGLEWDGFSWLNSKNGWGNLPMNDPKLGGFHTMAKMNAAGTEKLTHHLLIHVDSDEK
jgi:hypothetical protein